MQGDAAAASASLFKQRNALAGQIVSDEAATFWICYRKSVRLRFKVALICLPARVL